MADPMVIGVDAGATTTRCALSGLDGTILARAESGGANRNSSATTPAAALTTALGRLLERSADAAARVVSGVIGIAGGSAERAATRAAAQTAWRAAGLRGRLRTVTDLEVGFAAGSPSPDGLLLLAGTGAAAAAFTGGRLTHRCDGYGWLLGDEGSAVWLGRAGLRAVLRSLDGRGPATLLTGTLAAALRVPAGDDQALVRAAFDRPPAALGRLAPAVSATAAAGDTVALRITAEAADHLLHTLETVAARAALLTPAVVLAGSVLLTPGPVAERVRAAIREHDGTSPADATYGPAGALWLAIQQLDGVTADAAVHARLTQG